MLTTPVFCAWQLEGLQGTCGVKTKQMSSMQTLPNQCHLQLLERVQGQTLSERIREHFRDLSCRAFVVTFMLSFW